MSDLAAVAAAFGGRLHDAGLATTPERAARFVEIVTITDPSTRAQLYWAARLAFVLDRSGIEIFDRVFEQVFAGRVDVADVDRNPNRGPAVATADTADRRRTPATRAPPPEVAASGQRRLMAPGDAGDRADALDAGAAELAAAAALERLGSKPFDACTPEELTALGRLIAQLAIEPPMRAGRRTRRSRHRGQLDRRSTLRAARRTGGDPVRHLHRARRPRRRRVVLISDVSGSMEAYARAYLYLLHGAVRALDAEAFVFATRLSRLTRQLAGRHPGAALASARAVAPDWSGGTRIGEALRAFNDGWGRRGLAHGAVVVIVSDGWEAGDASLLEREMGRLSRLAHRIVWVNPRRQSERFEPRTAGMAAALPHVDAFVSGHSLAALDEVIDAIAAR